MPGEQQQQQQEQFDPSYDLSAVAAGNKDWHEQCHIKIIFRTSLHNPTLKPSSVWRLGRVKIAWCWRWAAKWANPNSHSMWTTALGDWLILQAHYASSSSEHYPEVLGMGGGGKISQILATLHVTCRRGGGFLSLLWLSGLGVWFALRVREVPGSNPGWAPTTSFFCCLSSSLNVY